MIGPALCVLGVLCIVGLVGFDWWATRRKLKAMSCAPWAMQAMRNMTHDKNEKS